MDRAPPKCHISPLSLHTPWDKKGNSSAQTCWDGLEFQGLPELCLLARVCRKETDKGQAGEQDLDHSSVAACVDCGWPQERALVLCSHFQGPAQTRGISCQQSCPSVTFFLLQEQKDISWEAACDTLSKLKSPGLELGTRC